MAVGSMMRVLASRLPRALLKGMMRDRVSIFMLHRLHSPDVGIQGHTIEFVKESIRVLRDSGAEFVPLSAMVQRWRRGERVDSNWIAFTVDDGFEDQARLVQEAFIPTQCPVTVFLITGFLDGRLWPWDTQLSYTLFHAASQQKNLHVGASRLAVDLTSTPARRESLHRLLNQCKLLDDTDLYGLVRQIAADLEVELPLAPPPEFRPMSWDSARALERQGVEFGAHSVTHRIFSHLSEQDARSELLECWTRLREELVSPLPVLAWPTGRTGDFADKDIALARSIGMQACLATDSNYAHVPPGVDTSLFSLRRFALPRDMTTVLRYGSWLERGRQLVPL